MLAHDRGGLHRGLDIVDGEHEQLGPARSCGLEQLQARSVAVVHLAAEAPDEIHLLVDRKSTRLNSSHLVISYAVFCLKKTKLCGYPSIDFATLGARSPALFTTVLASTASSPAACRPIPSSCTRARSSGLFNPSMAPCA